MKKQTEYVLHDSLEPKTFFQKLLRKIGLWKPRKLEEHEKVIQRPTNAELGIPTEYEYGLKILEVRAEPIVNIIMQEIYNSDCGLQKLIDNVRNRVKDVTEEQFFEARKLALEKQYIFFDGVMHSLSPIGRKVTRLINHTPVKDMSREVYAAYMQEVLK